MLGDPGTRDTAPRAFHGAVLALALFVATGVVANLPIDDRLALATRLDPRISGIVPSTRGPPPTATQPRSAV